tara:strand:- start:670 stop:948 length:279 start_codon:yes stop_codon:yes gene_type:complete
MKDWSWIARRRNLSLEDFLSNVSSIEAALKKFAKLDIIPPEKEILQSFFNENTSSKTLQTERPEEQQITEDLSPTPPTTKYDDLVIIETEEI